MIMKNKETDIDEGIDFSEEAFKKRFKRVTSDHRKHLKNVTLRDCKSRINILLDADILEFFKERASEKGGLPYQTQINQALRQFMDDAKQPKGEVVTMEMLDNPAFISALAEKLKAA